MARKIALYKELLQTLPQPKPFGICGYLYEKNFTEDQEAVQEELQLISAQDDEKLQEQLIRNYMSLPNQVWNDIIRKASTSVEVLTDQATVQQMYNIIKTNYHACKALGHSYIAQLKIIYLDMLCLYKVMSENITSAITKNGENVMKQPIIRSMRCVKKEILKLINEWVSHTNDHKVVLHSFIPKLLDAILLDYKNCTVPSAREPEVLSTMSTVVKKLENHITTQIPAIFDAVLECTLDMINKDFQEYPEHRTNFYILLQQVVTYCFSSLLHIVPAQFKLILDSIIWAFKHTMRNVADTGLHILFNLLENMSKEDPVYSNMFYQTYYTDIMQHMFSVVTDTSHTAGLTMQANILAYMFYIVESGKITTPLNPTVQSVNGQSNVLYVQDFVSDLLKSAFSHLSEAQIKITVQRFFNLDQDVVAFKEHLRDFLVQIKEKKRSVGCLGKVRQPKRLRVGETPEQRAILNRERHRELVRRCRAKETTEQRVSRLEKNRESGRRCRAEETTERRAIRLEKYRQYRLKKKEEKKRRVQLSVPDIINPHDLPEVMEDDN